MRRFQSSRPGPSATRSGLPRRSSPRAQSGSDEIPAFRVCQARWQSAAASRGRAASGRSVRNSAPGGWRARIDDADLEAHRLAHREGMRQTALQRERCRAPLSQAENHVEPASRASATASPAALQATVDLGAWVNAAASSEPPMQAAIAINAREAARLAESQLRHVMIAGQPSLPVSAPTRHRVCVRRAAHPRTGRSCVAEPGSQPPSHPRKHEGARREQRRSLRRTHQRDRPREPDPTRCRPITSGSRYPHRIIDHRSIHALSRARCCKASTARSVRTE